MNHIKEYSDNLRKGRNRMNRILRVGIFTALASFPTWAAQQTLTGQISDSMCGANHAAMGDMGKNPKECTAACQKWRQVRVCQQWNGLRHSEPGLRISCLERRSEGSSGRRRGQGWQSDCDSEDRTRGKMTAKKTMLEQ
jgi:hypothetical protein